MAKVRINTGGKIVLVVLGLALVGVAAWMFIPKKGVDEGVKPEFSTVGEDGEPGKDPGGDSAGKGDDKAKPPVAASPDLKTPGLGRPMRTTASRPTPRACSGRSTGSRWS